MPVPTHDSSCETSTQPTPPTGGGRRRQRNRRRRRPGAPPNQPARPPAQPTPDPIIAIPPGAHDACEVTGVLREVDRSVNPMRAFGYADDGPMAIALARSILGRRWVEDFARVTIHTPRAGAGADSDQQASYTAWLPAAAVRSPRIKPGITVAATLVSIDVSDRYRAWYCDDFRPV